jgi:hypothetical protein
VLAEHIDAANRRLAAEDEVDRGGIENPPNPQCFKGFGFESGAETGALEPHLAEIVSRWVSLPKEVRVSIYRQVLRGSVEPRY